MKQTLALFCVLSIAGSVLAQEPAKRPKVAVVSLQRVFRDSQMGKAYAAQLDALQKDLDARIAKSQGEVQKMEAAMKALQDQLEQQGAVLAEDAKAQKQQELTRKGRERTAFVEDARAELQRIRDRAEQQAGALRNDFQAKVKPFIDEVAKDKGIDILLEEQASTVAVLGKDFDLTQAVVAKADEGQKAPKAAAATPKPTPATPPKPTPASPPKPKP